ncbi:uncharacterized protein LOC136027884 isoform X2 [Artemia franciscana]
MELFLQCLLVVAIGAGVKGHGRLIDPPSRSSAWRYGFGTPNNFNDHEIYCGGFSRQHSKNRGKCGPCGDAWDLPVPRPNEGGGKYGTGTVVRTYQKGSEVEFGIELTANHHGHFEFRICQTENPREPETNECFDKHVLKRADGEGEKWQPGPGSNVVFKPTFRLPEDLTCLNCVLQWRYIAGNNWGMCPDGTGKVGCGTQEEFRACADITITDDGLPDNTTTTIAPTPKPSTRVPLTGRPRPPYVPPPRRTKTPPTTTTTMATTTENLTTSELPVTTPSNPGVYEGYDHVPHLAPYVAGLVILGALLFTLLFFLCIIVYFYRGHAYVKAFIKDHGKERRFWLTKNVTSQYPSSVKTDKNVPTFTAPITISHSVVSVPLHSPVVVPTVSASMPASPPRKLNYSHSRAKKRAPEPPPRNPTTALTVSDVSSVSTNVPKYPVAISEPMNVAINGVSVARDSQLEITDIYVPPSQFYSGDSTA